jgi:hypothetical protein
MLHVLASLQILRFNNNHVIALCDLFCVLRCLLHVSADYGGSYGSIIVGRAAACSDHGSP